MEGDKPPISPAASRKGRKRPKASPKSRRGYHRAVTPGVAAEFCRRIASGRTLLAVCRDADMPHHDAIYNEMAHRHRSLKPSHAPEQKVRMAWR